MKRGDIAFVFEGRALTAREGDTVAAALFAHGVKVFGRSSKYHRPRGYRCGRGHCSACAMRVDGLPGVLACVTPVRAGMTVAREHAWPNADWDVLRAADALAPLLPPGFYYRRFRRSPRLFAAFERGLAHLAGHGELASAEAARRLGGARCRRDEPDVLVVGGGVAGLSAALAAASEGARVLLVEQDDRLGGRLADDPSSGEGRELAARATSHSAIETLTGATAIGWYEEGVVAVDLRPDLLLVRPAAVVLATGGYDRALPFAGWDLPGVMTAQGAQLLLRRHGVLPGSRAVVLTVDDLGDAVAGELRDAGVEVVCVADCRPPQALRQRLVDSRRADGLALIAGVAGARAHGSTCVTALSLLTGESGSRTTARHSCDMVCVSAGVRPADDLVYQATAGGSIVLAAGPLGQGTGTGAQAASGDSVPGGPWLAGLVAGARTADEALAQGTAAGSAAARHVRAAADPA